MHLCVFVCWGCIMHLIVHVCMGGCTTAGMQFVVVASGVSTMTFTGMATTSTTMSSATPAAVATGWGVRTMWVGLECLCPE